jgi:gliding motility-associated-like protein
MKRLFYGLAFILAFTTLSVSGQDFSNKGKDFWVGYGYHQVMTIGNQQQMVLYFATDAVTTVTVEIPGLGYSQTYPNIPANTIFTSNPLPKATGSQDARLMTEGVLNKGIHITSDKPIVAYTHIYNQSVSGATLLFPTPTLGKEYYSVNHEQISNTSNANCWVYAIAVDTGITSIEVIPSESTLTHAANVPFTVNLQQGQILNLMGVTTNSSPFTGSDLTGTKIRSIGSGTSGCKRIAVFSGSGRISLSCNGSAPSSDNYIVQAFPKNAWGKKYLTVPTKTLPNNFFRICVSDPTTVVTFNGAPISGPLIKNFYYQINTNQPGLIEADKPIMVSQVITSQGECSNGSPGDPEVIYLSPVEQNIDKVILNSTSNFSISQHWINVVIKAAAAASFKIDGTPSPGSFTSHPRDPNYVYAQLSVGAGQHTLSADSGFNAIAYGLGNAESYGYNAGTNVKDLYQFVSIQNQFATINFPSTCKNTPFLFSMTFPYQPAQIKWVFGSALNAMGINDITVNSPVFDSTWMVNGKQLYRYKLPGTYSINTVGTYPIKVLAQNPTPDGCSGEQEINYDVQIFERPVADFNFTASGCVSDSVRFTDNSNTFGRPSTKWFWDFEDGQTSELNNPAHLYTAAGSYDVKLSVVSDIGCLSDTATKTVVLSEPPVARFGIAAPFCVGKTVTFTDSSSTTSSSIVKWTWDFGDGSAPRVATTNAPQTHTYANAGPYSINLQVENASGCKSIVFSTIITVASNPTANFNYGKACLPAGAVQFTDASTISDGTQNLFSYSWNFGDGGTSQAKNPAYNYSAAGPYLVSLKITSSAGCIDSIRKNVDSVYAQPQARFNAPTEVCLGTTINFTDQSTTPNSTPTGWLWDFGDGSAPSTQQNPTHNYAAPGTYSVSLIITSAVGCVSAPEIKPVIINGLPVADFTPSSPTCVTKTITFNDGSTPNSGNLNKWTWNFGDGSATSSQPSPTHTYATTGTYSVTLQVETNKGCVSTVQSKPVIISPLPVAGFIMPGNCVNDPITQFIDTSSIADNSEAQFTYLWNFGDQNASGANPNTSTIKDATHKYTATGDYNVTLTVTSNNGCSSSVTQVFTINGAVPVSTFTVQGGLQHCSGDSIRITDNSTVNPGKLVKLEIYWDYTGDPTNKIIIDNPTAGVSYSHLYPEFFTPATKDYQIKFIAYSGINCLTERDTTITLIAKPDIIFPAVTPVCADVDLFQLQAGTSNMTGGNFVFSGTGVSSTGLFDPKTTGPGTYSIRYTYTGANGCSNFKEQDVVVYPVPTVSAGPDKFVLEGGSATLNSTSNGPGLSYLWSPVTYLNNAAIAQPITTPKDDITYKLTVTSADGCSASSQVSVKVLKAPTIPNVFSPNGDGIHDKWEIKYLESYPGATVEIYNRYGQKVFESRGYSKPWDGTYKGSQLPASTYYYIINPKNGRQQIAGYVDIIR